MKKLFFVLLSVVPALSFAGWQLTAVSPAQQPFFQAGKSVATPINLNTKDYSRYSNIGKVAQRFEFTLLPGSLRHNLMVIAASNQWQLIWKAPTDYHVVAKAPYTALSTADGFAKILKPYPLKATFYQHNHVVVVTPRNKEQRQQVNSVVAIKKQAYVDLSPIDIQSNPSWLQQPVTINGTALPFAFYSRVLLAQADAAPSYQSGLDIKKPVTLHYQGNIQGALNQLANKTGYSYRIMKNKVYWQAYTTKTFNIAIVPWVKGNDTMTPIWNDLKATLDKMRSNQGKLVISPATATVTVLDRPTNVKQIEHYILKLNQQLSQQVRIKVQVLHVDNNVMQHKKPTAKQISSSTISALKAQSESENTTQTITTSNERVATIKTKTGTALYVLPKVIDKHIYLRVATNVASLTHKQSDQNYLADVKIQAGKTLMLANFSQAHNKKYPKTSTVLLITPYIN